MKPNQWVTIASFQMQVLPEQLDLLLARREWLFHQQQDLQERRAALARQQHELLERRTTHELECHVFWRRLQRAAETQQSEETGTVPAAEGLPVRRRRQRWPTVKRFSGPVLSV